MLLVVSVLAIGAAASSPPELARSAAVSARRLTTHTITVNLTCGNDSDDWVSDSTINAVRGDTIEWVLTPESNVEDFKVRKKRLLGRWLFERGEVPGAPGNPARGNDMKPDAQGRYIYEIKGRCRGPEKADIDPEIIIDT